MRFESLVLALAVSSFVSVASAQPAATTTSDSATAAAPAVAGAPSTAPAPVADADADKVVCHIGPAPTGTRLGSTRECHTQREWDRIRQEQANMVSSHQNAMGCGPSGCGH